MHGPTPASAGSVPDEGPVCLDADVEHVHRAICPQRPHEVPELGALEREVARYGEVRHGARRDALGHDADRRPRRRHAITEAPDELV